MATLEHIADAAILAAAASGVWPARAHTIRQALDHRAVEAIIAKYRHAGWAVEPGHAGCYFTIDHPERHASQGARP